MLLYQSGVSLSQIHKYLQKTDIADISTNQIQELINNENVEKFTVETEELINYIQSKNVVYHMFDLPDQQGITRIAALTIQQSEIENLNNFGDVFFIGGTYAALENKCKFFPYNFYYKRFQYLPL